MDTPKLSNFPSRVSDHGYEDIVMKEDSGYVTTTPNSAESTGIENSFLSINPYSKNLHTVYTPCINNNIRSSYFTLKPSPDDVAHITTIDEGHCSQNTLVQSLVDDKSSSSSFVIKRKSKLKRQDAFSTYGSEISPSQVINARFIKMHLNPIHEPENGVKDISPNESSRIMSNSTPLLPGCSKQLKRTHLKTSTSLRCPYTPVKNKRKKFSPEKYSRYSDSSFSSDDNLSPMFNLYEDARHPKKLHFNPAQKIGENEKNQLLYPEIKPVTPPKKIKTPEKLRKQAILKNNFKCRKSLWMNKQNYCGLDHIDFLKMLGEKQSHRPAIKSIFSQLSDEDLENVSKVSLSWRFVLLSDPVAEERRRKSCQMKEREKENLSSIKSKKLEGPSSSFGGKCFMEVQNHMNSQPPIKKTIQRSPPVSPGKRRFNSFNKAASVDSKVKLRCCPRCESPAKIVGKFATCSRIGCGFSFCIKCLAGRSNKVKCCQRQIESLSPSKEIESKTIIGSKLSRKNLRRL